MSGHEDSLRRPAEEQAALAVPEAALGEDP
ncbi:hypothetical protein ABIA38_005756 [Embleya sp. AB8]